MLAVLIRRLAGDRVGVKKKGYEGCSELLRKGANQLRAFADLGCAKFVVCHDSDGAEVRDVHAKVLEKVVRPSGVAHACILIPVEEIEAWILADLPAVSQVITSWTPSHSIDSPELVRDPKERLEYLSRNSQKRPLYNHAVHNPRVAAHLDIEVVRAKCPSFLPLFTFATSN